MLFSLSDAGLIFGLDGSVLKNTIKENITKFSDNKMCMPDCSIILLKQTFTKKLIP